MPTPTPPNDDNTLTIDFAVLSQDYTPIVPDKLDSHITDLDTIHISLDDFKYLFYKNAGPFGLTLDTIGYTSPYFKYITFLPPFRTIQGNNYSLLENIILNIEDDLGLTRNAFSTTSLIELEKDISSKKTLCDIHINSNTILAALSWKNIVSIINTANKTRINGQPPYTFVELILSVNFITPNQKILKTVVKFSYLIDITVVPLC